MESTNIPENFLEEINLNNLEKISCEDIEKSPFRFLGLSKIFIDYEIRLEKVDSFVARIAGSDSRYNLVRKGIGSIYLDGDIPKGTTHYYFGERQFDEELYVNNKSSSNSRDIIPVVFLQK